MRLVMRVQYHPARCFNRAMYLTGRWRIWDWVDDSVLLGGSPARREIRRLRDLGVTAVVNMCEEFRGHRRTLARNGLVQLWLPTTDFYPPSLDALIRGVEFLLDRAASGERTYVHCKAGQGRSATLVMCYLMAAQGLSARAAFRRIWQARPHITPRLYRRPVVREFGRWLAARERAAPRLEPSLV